jgi:hypothetical protein
LISREADDLGLCAKSGVFFVRSVSQIVPERAAVLGLKSQRASLLLHFVSKSVETLSFSQFRASSTLAGFA